LDAQANETISSTLEDYLETILVLTNEKGAARVRDISVCLGVHKSTVTSALKSLCDKGLLNYAPYEIATLTDEGKKIAKGVRRIHKTIYRFLKDTLLLDEETAEQNACRLEHVMDRKVVDRLVLFEKTLTAHQASSSCLQKFSDACGRIAGGESP
jgi:DtxR family transcriptional regulator, Mn-dependent transcriptional regulator